MIDTHCHLDLAAFDADRDDVIARATAAGVIGILVPAIRPRTWPALVELAGRHPCLRIALGVHPQIVPELDAGERVITPEMLAAAIASAGAVAVGECGLDGGTGERDLQESLLRCQIRAARAIRRPLVIHVLRAHDAAVRILREERVGEVGGVLHSYSGGAALVPVYRDLGLAFSFAGPVTFANARRPIAAARAVPDDLLLAETDAPDQTPDLGFPRPAGSDRHRGARNEPAFLPSVIAGLAAAREMDVPTIARLTMSNARARFAAWA